MHGIAVWVELAAPLLCEVIGIVYGLVEVVHERGASFPLEP